MIEFLLPLLEAEAAGGGGASLLSALGAGTMAGTPMTGGMQGPTQGSGLLGALSGGGMNPLAQMATGAKFMPEKEQKQAAPQYQFTQNRFRPTMY